MVNKSTVSDLFLTSSAVTPKAVASSSFPSWVNQAAHHYDDVYINTVTSLADSLVCSGPVE